jgi:hypothetical protein
MPTVEDWDREVRMDLSDDGYWFAPISPLTGKIDSTVYSVGDHRYNLARINLKIWHEKVGLPYRSPHKFRHGHIQYGLKNAEDIADYKAVSMNVVHSSMSFTDKIYSRMKDEDIHTRISNLGANSKKPISSKDETLQVIQEFLEYQEKTGRIEGKCALANLIKAPRSGLEPLTYRLTAGCSAIELPRKARGL